MGNRARVRSEGTIHFCCSPCSPRFARAPHSHCIPPPRSQKSKVDSPVLLVFHNLPVLHFNAVHPLHLGAIGSRSLHARSWIFLQNLGAVLPAENLVIGGLNVRWFVLLPLLNPGRIHDCAQMTKVSHIFLCFAPRLMDKKN